MEQTRVGAIGCGYWGPNLIRCFAELPVAEMHAVADLSTAQLDKIRQRHPHISVATTDYRELFELNLDAVAISTPAPTHFKIAQDCLEHGLHVLVEKPLTLDSRSAQELIDCAARNNRILMVGHTFEYNPAVRALKAMIDRGELGQIYYIDAIRASLGLFQTKLDVIWDLAPHDISILMHLLDEAPTSINARGSACVQTDVVDIAYLTMMFPNNVFAHSRMSWLDPCKTRRITVVGSEKMVVYDDVESLEKLRVYNKRVEAHRQTDTFGEFQFAYHYGDVVSPYVRFEEPLRLECLHFVECIRNGEKPLTDGHNGLRVVRAIEAAQRSMSDGGATVQVPSEDGLLEKGRIRLPAEMALRKPARARRRPTRPSAEI